MAHFWLSTQQMNDCCVAVFFLIWGGVLKNTLSLTKQSGVYDRLQWRHQTIDLRLELIVQILVVGMFTDQQRNGATFHAHRSAQI